MQLRHTALGAFTFLVGGRFAASAGPAACARGGSRVSDSTADQRGQVYDGRIMFLRDVGIRAAGSRRSEATGAPGAVSMRGARRAGIHRPASHADDVPARAAVSGSHPKRRAAPKMIAPGVTTVVGQSDGVTSDLHAAWSRAERHRPQHLLLVGTARCERRLGRRCTPAGDAARSADARIVRRA